MNKNDIFDLEITDMGVDGEGIGHYEGMTFFVKDALIGDVITAKVMKMKKLVYFILPNFHLGRLVYLVGQVNLQWKGLALKFSLQ